MAEGADREGEARAEDPVVHALGASLGEAKWSAMKELEPRFPGITAECVRFEVLDQDQDESRSAGAGGTRVRAEVDLDAWRMAARQQLPEEPAERLRAVVTRVVQELGLRATVDVEESDEELRATVEGDDLGLLIGKHGTTIDALQHVAMRAALRGGTDRKQVTVDAAGYRERREATLRRAADRAVADALRFGRPVELEPMRALERKVVHNYLSDRAEVETHSEGDEPDRRLVVTPVRTPGP